MLPTVPYCLRLACLLLGGVAAWAPGHGQILPQLRHDAEPWRVVVLTSVDPGLPAVRLHEQAFHAALRAAAPGRLVIFNESLDTQRFDAAELAPEFIALLRRKYRRQPVDLVVGISSGAIDLIREHHAHLWPGAQVLLAGLDEGSVDVGRLPAGATRVSWQLDIAGTLDLAEALQPSARQLVVVGGDAPVDRALTERVAQLALQRPRWQTEVWQGLPWPQLQQQLAALQPGAAVFFTTMFRDPTGRALFAGDVLPHVVAAATVPVYGLYETYIGRGATAGRVVSFQDAGRQAAAQALALLQGQQGPPDHSVPPRASRCMADHRQLQAHGLSAQGLPADCELRHLPRNLWTEYREAVLVAVAVLGLQSLTIAALLLQRRRRQAAEADALRGRAELARAMRFAAMGELTASIAHEINQPLGAILANAEAADLLIRRGTASPEVLREILADIRRDDLRAHEVIRRLRRLLEKHEVEQVPTHLHAALGDVLSLLAGEAQRRGVVIESQFAAADDRLLGDPVQLQQVLMNLAINAMDAMDDAPAGARRLQVRTAERGDSLLLTVADRGCGIEPARRAQVFESFHTTKPHGLGLGLPIVRAIVEAHGGTIDLRAREGGGSCFAVTLPRRLPMQPADMPGLASGLA